ncbi:histidine-phosphotransfer domain HPT domain-containing protein [Mycena crocata]|nr:histidine-phosphotransfer domain HPT domain-containing protein [Mycena crocata]
MAVDEPPSPVVPTVPVPTSPAPADDSKPDSPRTPRPPPTDDPVPEPEPSSKAEPIDIAIFEQILELDEEDTHDFSKEMVTAYFSQAGSTFDKMDTAFAAKDLPELSALGHFLKGSSAALGISKVQATCEKMQHYGELRDEDADKDLAADEALALIDTLLGDVKQEYADAERWLRQWYKDHKESFDDPAP